MHLFVAGHRAAHLPMPTQHHRLPDEERCRVIQDLNGTPPALLSHPEIRQLLVPLLRADFAVCETSRHREEPPLDCPITTLGGLDDPEAPPQELVAWRRHTRGDFAVETLAGGHFFLQTRPTACSSESSGR